MFCICLNLFFLKLHIFRHTFIIPFLIWYHLSKIDQIHLRAVMDTSNTPKGCNVMYVEDVEDGKRTYTHILVLFDLRD